MPTAKTVVSARAGCRTSASTVNSTVAPSQRQAWIRVRYHGTLSAVRRSSRVGVCSWVAQRRARSEIVVPTLAPMTTATPT